MSSSPSPTLAPATPAPSPAAAAAAAVKNPVSDWSPLRNPVFRAMWIASAVSYIGYEIRNYAAPLLMVDFKKLFGVSDGMAAYTFTASTLPIPLLVLLAGALADVLDRRKLLIVTHLWMMAAAGALGLLTISHLMTPWLMLGLLFLIGAGFAMANPAFLAVLPELVEPAELRSALALNSVNLNIARVMGPAIGGVIVAIIGKQYFYAGKGTAFLATAISLSGVVWVLARWNPPEHKPHPHPESIWGAIRTGFRYTCFSPRLIGILARVFLFIFCAGILPTFSGIICKKNVPLLRGDTGAAILMVCLGVGAILGVYLMQALQRRFGAEEVVTVCTVAYGAAMLGVATTPNLWLGGLAMFIAGFNWVIVPTNFNIATQLAVPAWIKGRAMGMYVLVLWGSMAAGSAFFGRIMTGLADPKRPDYGPRHTLMYAGIGVLVGSIAILWLRLQPRTKEDLAPAAKRGPLPQPESISDPLAPLRVTVEYRVAPARQHDFRQQMHHLRAQRLRNGAEHWHLEPSDGERFTETFTFPSWPARIRHADRTTRQDWDLQETIRAFHEDPEGPRVSYASFTGDFPMASASRAARPAIRPTGTLATRAIAAFDREFVRFFDRMAAARERDPLRFRPRPAVKILPLPDDDA